MPKTRDGQRKVLMKIRKLKPDDLERVLAIENRVQIAPWEKLTFELCFSQGYAAWVAEIDQKITGFLVASLKADECHILNLAVHHAFQHQGIGKKLMQKVLHFAAQATAKIVYLEVRETNHRAIELYEKLNFKQIGRRKDYYPAPNGKEDALIYMLLLN